MADDDADLLGAWRAGDRGSGEKLFERYFDGIYRFFRGKVDASEVADLVQKTYLACVEGSASFAGQSSVRTYFFAIARHQLFHHYRSLRRAPQLDFGVSSLTDLAPSPSSAIAHDEERRLLYEALARLPLDLQIAVELRFVEELRGPELARVLDVPEGTVRSRLRRALDTLRAEIERLAVAPERRAAMLRDLGAWRGELDAAAE